MQALGDLAYLVRGFADALGQVCDVLLALGQELVQRRVQQAHGDRQAVHHREQGQHVLALEHLQLVQENLPFRGGLGQDHGPHRIDATGLEEHMLGAAQADALGPQFPGFGGILGGFGVGAHPQAAVLVGPGQQGLEVIAGTGLGLGNIAQHDLAGGAVQGDDIAAPDDHAVGGGGGAFGVVDADVAATGDGTHAHAPGHHRRVGGHAAQLGEHTGGHFHAVDVFGGGLAPHQDDTVALRHLQLRLLGGEYHLAGGTAGAGRQAVGHDVGLGSRVDHGVQESLHVIGGDAHQRLALGDESLFHHVHRDFHRCAPGALAAAGLQHVEPAFLDGEFQVLHIPVVLLQQGLGGIQLIVDMWLALL